MDAKNPVIITESSGREPEGYAALIALAELFALPVIEGNQSSHTNFPRDHELHQGIGQRGILDEADLIVTIRCRAPWYPPSDKPARATVVAIDETPFRPHMGPSCHARRHVPRRRRGCDARAAGGCLARGWYRRRRGGGAQVTLVGGPRPAARRRPLGRRRSRGQQPNPTRLRCRRRWARHCPTKQFTSTKQSPTAVSCCAISASADRKAISARAVGSAKGSGSRSAPNSPRRIGRSSRSSATGRSCTIP